MRDQSNDETVGPSEPTTETSGNNTAGSVAAAPERADPIAVAVSTAYEARMEQLAAYANSGRFPSFAVKEIEAKLSEVVRERADWERANGGGGE